MNIKNFGTDANALLEIMWKKICDLQDEVDDIEAGGTGWSLVGNSNIIPTNFLGTINSADLIIKTNNVERIRVLSSGFVGVNNTAPTANLDIDGQIRIRGGIPGLGKVLTSDINGLATWQVPATIPITTAQNGLSLSGTTVVLGNNVGDVLSPAALLSSRDIVTGNFTVRLADLVTPTNYLTLGAGTLNSASVNKSNPIFFSETSNTNSGIIEGALATLHTVQFSNPGYLNNTTLRTTLLGFLRFNTVSTATNTITSGPSSSKSAYYGTIQFENDIAASNNTINIVGNNCAVFTARIEFDANVGGQIKTVTGEGLGFLSQFNMGNSLSSWGTFVDFHAGQTRIGSSPGTISKRIGLRIEDLGSTGRITTRYGIAQLGSTDLNHFAGFSGFGVDPATARIHIGAGTTAANTAPLKLNSGPLMTTPENGAVEYEGTHFYATIGSTRYQLDQQTSLITASNGITKSVNNIQLGGPINIPTTLTMATGGDRVTFNGISSSPAFGTLQAIDDGVGHAILALQSNVSGKGMTVQHGASGGVALNALSTSGTALAANDNGSGLGIDASSVSGIPIRSVSNPLNGNTTSTAFYIIRNNGTPATGASVGMGADILIGLEDGSSSGTVVNAGKISSYWTDATVGSEKSSLDLWTIHNGVFDVKQSIKSTGQIQLPKYGANTFSGTANRLVGVDATGNVLEANIVTSPATQGITFNGNVGFADNPFGYFRITNSNNKSALSVANTAGTGISASSTTGSAFGASGVEGASISGSTGYGLTVFNTNETVGSTLVPLNSYRHTSANDNTLAVLSIGRTTSAGSALAGFGSIIRFYAQNSTLSQTPQAEISTKWIDPTNGSTDADFSVSTVVNNVMTEKLNINNVGQLKLNSYGSGTFNVSPVQILGADATGNVVETSTSFFPLVSTSNVPPSTTPAKVGDLYIDVAAKKLYFATGTSSSADWEIAN